MSKVATLGYGASKMLLRLLELGGENEGREELMEQTGINSRTRYFEARKQLRELGLLDDEGNVNFIVSVRVPTRVQAPGPRVPMVTMTPEIEEDDSVVFQPGNWRQQAMQADLMPSDGVPAQRNSNFQKRRKVQIALLTGLIKEMFGYNLAESKAKDLLVESGDSAEAILDCAELTKAQPKEIEHPVGYIMSILKRRKQVAVEGGDDSLATGDTGFFLEKPSTHTVQVTAKMQALGLLEEEDDDY